MSYVFPSEKTLMSTSGAYKYIGVAASGSLTSSEVWQIMRLTLSGSEIVAIEWADGNKSPDNIWDDRESKAYS